MVNIEKNYIFITTEGTTLAPKEDYLIENCQMLGRSHGLDEVGALNNLMDDNPWIIEAGFSPAKIIAIQIL